MKKVLILANSGSGLYDFRNELVEELLKEYEVLIALPDSDRSKEFMQEGATVFHIPLNRRGMNPKQDWNLYKAYRKLMKEKKPDLVLTYTIKPNVYGGFAARMAKIPYLTNVTGLGSTFEGGSFKRALIKKLVVQMYKIGVKKASCVFFQNRENLEIFCKYGILKTSSKLIPGSGVNLSKHKYLEPKIHEKPHILYVGRLMREKGSRELFANIEKFKDSLEFDIIGNCEEHYEDRLKELCEAKDSNLKYHGYQMNPIPFYEEADAVVMPSYHEGMNNVILEASSAGRVVLATNISGCAEGVEDGKTGFLFEPESEKALSDAIERFLALSLDERVLMGKFAREKMEKEFDRKIVISSYMEEIHKIVL